MSDFLKHPPSHEPDAELDSVTVAAVEWFERMRQAELSAEERARFERWIAESPLHVREYLGAAELWGAFHATDAWTSESTDDLVAQARASSNVVALSLAGKEAAPLTATVSRPRRWRSIAAAAVALLAVGIATTAALRGYGSSGERLATTLGEQRSMVLSDGSVIQLNTLTRLEVHFDARRRRIELQQGEAFFRVAHDAQRPFEVVTPFGVVRAVGTEFNVYSREQDMRVAVVEGKVQVMANRQSSRAPATFVTARQSVEVGSGSGAARRLPATEVETATAWMQRRLAFENERLDTVVAEFNRYNRVTMRIEDADLAALKINGVFNADDPRALIGYLRRVQGVAVANESGSDLVLRREHK